MCVVIHGLLRGDGGRAGLVQPQVVVGLCKWREKAPSTTKNVYNFCLVNSAYLKS